ncbi:ribonuclease P [Candidatus Woesearchaeota archaeon]|nr:ribonuclease P [Candidatus Woesearchaeota archaeon]
MPKFDPRAKDKVKEIARERIKILFSQADEIFLSDRTLANRYVHLARAIAMKAKIRIPLELKRRYCKFCYHYLRAGVNSRIRTREGKVVILCMDCKKMTRIPTGKKDTAKKKAKTN